MIAVPIAMDGERQVLAPLGDQVRSHVTHQLDADHIKPSALRTLANATRASILPEAEQPNASRSGPTTPASQTGTPATPRHVLIRTPSRIRTCGLPIRSR